jgi:hypothetical protein
MSPAATTLAAQARGLISEGSKLSSALARAIAAAEADEQFVSSVSIDPAIILAALIAAHAENRDFSNFVAVALADYSRKYGAPPPVLAEFIAKVAAAHAATPGILPRLESTLRREMRPKKSAA